MNKFIIACVAATGFCGLAAGANAAILPSAAPPASVAVIASPATGVSADKIAELQTEVELMQSRMQAAGYGADGTAGAVFLSLAPAPNADGAPIPSGG